MEFIFVFIFKYIKGKNSSFSNACKGLYGFIKRKEGLESFKNDHKSDLNNIFKLRVSKFNTW